MMGGELRLENFEEIAGWMNGFLITLTGNVETSKCNLSLPATHPLYHLGLLRLRPQGGGDGSPPRPGGGAEQPHHG